MPAGRVGDCHKPVGIIVGQLCGVSIAVDDRKQRTRGVIEQSLFAAFRGQRVIALLPSPVLRPFLNREPDVKLAHDLVDGLVVFVNVMDLFHAESHISERIIF